MHHLQENAERKQVKTFSCLENIDSLNQVTSFFIQKPDRKAPFFLIKFAHPKSFLPIVVL